jgi:FkbM family methyltransferase
MDIRTLAGLVRSLVIYRGQPWKQRRLAAFYGELLTPGDLCFDVGAHVGSRSRAMVKAGARVVALEPQPAFLDFLRRFVRSPDIEIVGAAAGSESGRLTLHISRRHPTVTTMSRDWIDTVGKTKAFSSVDWDEAVEVPVTTLDALIETHGLPRFCKIDVEGLEPDILAGLSQPIPIVAFEYIPEALDGARACIDRLEALGRYRFNWVVGERHKFAEPHWLSAADMQVALTRASANGSGDIYARLEAADDRLSSTSAPGRAPTMLTTP